MWKRVLALAFHANSGDLPVAPPFSGAGIAGLHIHGGGYKALAASNVGSR